MNEDKAVNGIFLSINWLATLVQTNELFLTIQIILSCISTLVVLAYNIYKWYKKATEDKKITPDEIKELVDITTDGIEEIKEDLNKK